MAHELFHLISSPSPAEEGNGESKSLVLSQDQQKVNEKEGEIINVSVISTVSYNERVSMIYK